MKKFLLGTTVLIAICILAMFVQISCHPSVAQPSFSNPYVLPPATTSRLGGVIPDGTTITVDANGRISSAGLKTGVKQSNKILFTRFERRTNKFDGIYTADYDGSNQVKINIIVPDLPNAQLGPFQISPDGKIIIFEVRNAIDVVNISFSIYSCNIDGSNVRKIIDGGINQWQYALHGAY